MATIGIAPFGGLQDAQLRPAYRRGPWTTAEHSARIGSQWEPSAAHKRKKSETTKLLESKSFSEAMCFSDCLDYLNSPFEISEIQKTLVLHTLSVDRRQVLWFRPTAQKGRQLSGMRMRRTI